MWYRSEVLRPVREPYLHIRAKQIIPVYPWSHSILREKQDMMCMCQQHTTPHHTTQQTTPHNKLHHTTPHNKTNYTAPHHITQQNKLHHTTPHHTTPQTTHHTDNRLCDTYESDWNSNINFYIHPTRTQDTPHDILNTHLIS